LRLCSQHFRRRADGQIGESTKIRQAQSENVRQAGGYAPQEGVGGDAALAWTSGIELAT
jgi:hypothetical protein